MSFNTEYSGLEMAIIGISCKFPDSENYRAFWDNLCQGKESVREYSDEEILSSGVNEAYLNNESFIKSGIRLEDKEFFDYGFFDYRNEEAAFMDPQIRIMHEHCWKAIEDAGYASAIEKNKIGLFLGAAENVEWKMNSYLKSKAANIDPFILNLISNSQNISSLISYKLNLTGPSLYVNTTCSTSLASVNLACKSLLNRECNIAIAGGVKINSSRQKGYLYQKDMIYSKDGHCRAFDKDSSGTISGEGLGVLVIKRLSDAIKDKDNIYCVIRACVANNDGNNKVGYTAPSVKGQAECIRLAYKMAGVAPSSIGYIEAHGTGTKLGDPIELRALNLAFDAKLNDKSCAIGSVKTNIGHLDVAAGVAGLIKAVLCIKYKKIPPSLNFTAPNPEIDFNGPFYVNQELKQWERKANLPLRAGVSSFGIGGTNVHIVLEEAKEQKTSTAETSYNLMVLSAKTADSLKQIKRDLVSFLEMTPEVHLSDLSHTLLTGRKDFQYRYATAFKSKEGILKALKTDSSDRYEHRKINLNQVPSVVFMFPGQGSQYREMGKELYNSEICFKEHIDKGFSYFQAFTGKDLKKVIFPESENETINQTDFAQPALFIFEFALAQLMISWGIKPQYFIGHSIGEYTAACLSGVFGFEDALKLIIKRGELMSRLPSGEMIVCHIASSDVRKYITEEISLAAINSDSNVALSGDFAAIERLSEQLSTAKIPFVKLKTSHAFHSHMLDPILADFLKELKKVKFNKPEIPFVSNVYGRLIDISEAMSPEYWMAHMRETVNFSSGLKTLLNENKETLFIEVGPGNTLINLLKQHHFEENKTKMINLMRHPKEQENDRQFLLKQLGSMWEYGLKVDWSLIFKEEKRKISLPTYAFEKISFPAEVNPFEDSNLPIDIFNEQKAGSFNECIYFSTWKSTFLIPSETVSNHGACLFFSLGDHFSEAFKATLMAKNIDVIEVFPEDSYIKHGSFSYGVNPYAIADLQKLALDLKISNIEFDNVIYSWNLEKTESGIEFLENNRTINLLYFSLIKIVKALAGVYVLPDLYFYILTDKFYNINNEGETKYDQSLTISLSNVISQEYLMPTVNLDFDLNEDLPELLSDMVDEIIHKNKDRVVALRNGLRWIQDHQQYDMPETQKTTQLRSGGVYLITGGLGNVGYILSRHLLKEYNARLIVVGRSKLEDLQNVASQRLNHLKSMGSLQYCSLDIADKGKFEKIVRETEQELGPINGVIHTAGMTDVNKFEYVEDITYENAFSTFSPKLKGIVSIYETFINKNVDFVWITSSLSSIVGGLKFASYAGSNLYIDSFITSKVKKAKNWKCVRFGEMSFIDETVGLESGSGKIALNPEEIVKVFELSLWLKGRMVISETILNLHKRIEKAFSGNKKANENNTFESVIIEKRERPALNNSYVAPTTDSEKEIVKIIEDYFGIAGIGIEDDFFELGGDSLKAMVLISKIKEIFGVDISLKEFFDNQSIKFLASKIDEKRWVNEDNNKKFISII
ncbi:SDR family NAD(P)-dependent oxidoreductase [Chryseobacterium sp. JV558]|uniref:SDR family NAD(P)-dependent oxidoreductase n=1 Tax=Chryseobacterium sp. JV558 TaxID=2663236 RepID=UPI00299D42F9|nr:SDR family NAD(P)-dependent oxidoreductase [Chryseobacterium sp. JV558]MDW9383068.1 SDR family NAD(P)-dependent oxidoreductase [Chryseobacterium sp. JV558]